MNMFRQGFVGIAVLTMFLSGTAANAAPDPRVDASEDATFRATNDINDIVGTSEDIEGRSAPLRRGYWDGQGGFGMDKIYHKHKINNPNIIYTTHATPAGGEQQSDGTTYIYFQTARLIECDWIIQEYGKGCEVKEDQKLKLVINYRDDLTIPTDPKTKGVITLYCDRGNPAEEECPGWVNETADYPEQGPWPYAL